MRASVLFKYAMSGPTRLASRAARNGRPGVQIVAHTDGAETRFTLRGEGFDTEWFQMVAVPVEYNTGDGETQDGDMVILPDICPDYAIRKAPFKVYDCLKPASNDSASAAITAVAGRSALYACLRPLDGLAPGLHQLELDIQTAEGSHTIVLNVTVADVLIPDEQFTVTNWFSLNAIARQHHETIGSARFISLLDQYIDAMRRVRQTTFFIELDDRCVAKREPSYSFDFEYLTPIIERFFAGGMTTLEIGQILSRGFKPDGMPDMLTDTFTCAMAPDVPLESTQGYDITTAYLRALADYLARHGWQHNVVVHIHDEPDAHYPDEATLEARRRQYYMAVAMLKKYLPQARVLEAVKTDFFRGALDIWVPTTSGYEAEQQSFDHMRESGDEVWSYVCCEPEDRWLNRFLDQKVIHSRLLFWGFERNRIAGFFALGLQPVPGGHESVRGDQLP